MTLTTLDLAPPATPVLPVPSATIAWSHLLNWRAERYRLRPNLRVQSEDAARAFLDDVGLAFLFPHRTVALPNLWDAINGHERDVPHHHHDHALGLAWSWKDTLPTRKAVWYGKLLTGRPTFVSLDLLPAFYALSSNFGEVDDYLQQYADGRMSVDARDVYEGLLREGPASTSVLRRVARLMGGGDVARRFDRAIAELQSDLKIVKAGVADDNRWKYCYVYDVLLRWQPTLAEEARVLSGRQAQERILTRYLHTVIAASPRETAALFGWDVAVTERLIGQLVERNVMQWVTVQGVPADQRARVGRKKAATAGDETWLMLTQD